MSRWTTQGRRGWLVDGWTALAGAVLPVECAGCGLPDVGLCPSCREPLAGAAGPVPAPPAVGCPPVTAVTRYAGPARAVLVAWKDHGRHDVAPVLAVALAEALGQSVSPAVAPLLVPVPSARRAVRRRGEDVVAALARRSAVLLRAQGRDVTVASVLRPARRVRDQSGLGARERAENLAGAFRVAGPAVVRRRTCVLVDDVVTTGSTLAEAARVLAGAGATVSGAAVVAATARLHPGRDAALGAWRPEVSGEAGVV